MALFPESLGKLRFLPFLVMLLILAAAGFLGWKYWQDQEIDKLRQAVSQGSREEAMERAQNLEKLSLRKREVQRLKALSVRKDDPEQALKILSPLLEDQENEDNWQNLLTYLEIAIEAGLNEQAQEALEAHRLTLSHEPDFLYWQARQWLNQDDAAEAVRTLDRLLSINTDHAQARLLLAKILLNLNTLASAVQAKVNLRIAANDPGPAGQEALIILATQPAIPLFPNDRTWLVRELKDIASWNTRAGLLAASQELILKPNDAQSIMDQTVKQYGAKDPALTADWLVSIGAYEQLLTFLDSVPGKQISADNVFNLRMIAALTLGKHELAQSLLESSKPGQISELHRLAMRAQIEFLQPPLAAEPTETWSQAYETALAADDSGILLQLSRIAYVSKWLAAANEAYASALARTISPVARAQILTEKVNVDLKNLETEQALADIQEFLKIYPDHSAMLNNEYYLTALLGKAPQKEMAPPSARMVEELDGYIWSTYALTLWRAGKPQAAAAALNKLPQKFMSTPSCQLVAILVAIDNKQLDNARALMDAIRVEALLPEERQLLQEARQRLQS